MTLSWQIMGCDTPMRNLILTDIVSVAVINSFWK